MTRAFADPAAHGDLDRARWRELLLPALSGWRDGAGSGAVRLLFLAPPASVRAVVDIRESADRFDELYVRDLQWQIERVATPGVAVALARREGRPRRRDRVLCGQLESRLATSTVRLVDFLTVGPDREWSLLRRRPPQARVRPTRQGP